MSAQPQNNKLRPVAGEGGGDNSSPILSTADFTANHGGTGEQKTAYQTDPPRPLQTMSGGAGARSAVNDGSRTTKLGCAATPIQKTGSKRKPKRNGKTIHVQLPTRLARRLEEMASLGHCTKTELISTALEVAFRDKRISRLVTIFTSEREQEETLRLVATLALILGKLDQLVLQFRASGAGGFVEQGARLVAVIALLDLERALRELGVFLEERHSTRTQWLLANARRSSTSKIDGKDSK
jgi:hypothetical protein